VTVELNDAERRELWSRCRRIFALAYLHYEDQGNQETLAGLDGSSWAICAGNFYEGLSAGRKIYVVKQRPPIAVAQALALLMELTVTACDIALGCSSPGRDPVR